MLFPEFSISPSGSYSEVSCYDKTVQGTRSSNEFSFEIEKISESKIHSDWWHHQWYKTTSSQGSMEGTKSDLYQVSNIFYSVQYLAMFWPIKFNVSLWNRLVMWSLQSQWTLWKKVHWIIYIFFLEFLNFRHDFPNRWCKINRRRFHSVEAWWNWFRISQPRAQSQTLPSCHAMLNIQIQIFISIV